MSERPSPQSLSSPLSTGYTEPVPRQTSYGDIYIRDNARVIVGDSHCHSALRIEDDTRKDSDLFERLHESLLFDRAGSRMLEVRKPLRSTCEWLFQHDVWIQWNKAEKDFDNNGFLWIKGKPGCGKSTLMKAALERKQAEKQESGKKPVIINYFFNARAKAMLEKSSLGLYRWLVYQILQACPDQHNLFLGRFSFKSPQSSISWSREELQDLLKDIIAQPSAPDLWVFIDALDEDEHQSDARQMIGFLVELSEDALANSTRALHICLSSRHYPHISVAKGLSFIVEEVVEHSKDINMYVSQKLRCFDAEEKAKLVTEICQRTANIFLWAVLVVEILNELDDIGAPITSMRARLDAIPDDLNTLFSQILMNHATDIEGTTLLLQWVLFAFRPLTPQELCTAIDYSRSTKAPSASFRAGSHPLQLHRTILHLSHGLVQLTTTAKPVVQLIHETVREFLVHGTGLASLNTSQVGNFEGHSHEILRSGCYQYIAKSKIPDVLKCRSEPADDLDQSPAVKESPTAVADRDKGFPFMQYAIENIYKHAEQAQESGLSQLTFLNSGLDQEGQWTANHRLWWNVYAIDDSYRLSSKVTLVYFLATQDLSHLLKCLLTESNKHIDVVCKGRRTALVAVSIKGHLNTCRVLLENGANANAYEGWKGLEVALTKKKIDLVRLLLEYGANVNAPGGYYGNALQAASSFGDPDSVSLLFQYGADVNAQGGEYGSALQAASARGNIDVARLLLQHGAKVNMCGGHYGDALQAASAEGRLEVVRLLIQHGANVNAQGGWHRNALRAAVRNDNVELVRFLIQHGADVNAGSGTHESALETAIKYGRKEIVTVLQRAGALKHTKEHEMEHTSNETGVRTFASNVYEYSNQSGAYWSRLLAGDLERLDGLGEQDWKFTSGGLSDPLAARTPAPSRDGMPWEKIMCKH